MKTNRTARRFVKIRGIVLGLALVGMVGIAFWSGQFLGTRVGRVTAPQTETQQAPIIDLGALLAAAR
jgi:hypothetical protein